MYIISANWLNVFIFQAVIWQLRKLYIFIDTYLLKFSLLSAISPQTVIYNIVIFLSL